MLIIQMAYLFPEKNLPVYCNGHSIPNFSVMDVAPQQ